MALIDLVMIAVFLILTAAAGMYFYRWVGDMDDFSVAGRRLTPFILAATLTATNVNLYSFVGQAGKAYAWARPSCGTHGPATWPWSSPASSSSRYTGA